MRELVYFIATSLDGFIAGEGGDVSGFLHEGDHIAALVDEFPETLPAPFMAALNRTVEPRRFDTVLMGYETYALGLRAGLSAPYPWLDQIVFSRRHTSTDDLVTVTDQDPQALVRTLKTRPGRDIWLCGGSVLAQQLAPEIDRLVLKVNPMLLGTGIALFGPPQPARASFVLSSSRPFASGVIMNEYKRVDQPESPAQP